MKLLISVLGLIIFIISNYYIHESLLNNLNQHILASISSLIGSVLSLAYFNKENSIELEKIDKFKPGIFFLANILIIGSIYSEYEIGSDNELDYILQSLTNLFLFSVIFYSIGVKGYLYKIGKTLTETIKKAIFKSKDH